jgi:hypothetical protein
MSDVQLAMRPRPPRIWLAVTSLLLGLLACEPVFVIGWQEWCILVTIFALLLGPALFRFWRTRRSHRKLDRDE